MAEDLGKRITKVPGFEWKLGMAVAGEYGELVINRAPYGYHGGKCKDAAELQLETEEWVYAQNAKLDLGHDANTGFLLRMLNDIGSGVETSQVSDGYQVDVLMPDTWHSYSFDPVCEHVNHALARAIIAASEAG